MTHFFLGDIIVRFPNAFATKSISKKPCKNKKEKHRRKLESKAEDRNERLHSTECLSCFSPSSQNASFAQYSFFSVVKPLHSSWGILRPLPFIQPPCGLPHCPLPFGRWISYHASPEPSPTSGGRGIGTCPVITCSKCPTPTQKHSNAGIELDAQSPSRHTIAQGDGRRCISVQEIEMHSCAIRGQIFKLGFCHSPLIRTETARSPSSQIEHAKSIRDCEQLGAAQRALRVMFEWTPVHKHYGHREGGLDLWRQRRSS
jgi:hypothetical protein